MPPLKNFIARQSKTALIISKIFKRNRSKFRHTAIEDSPDRL
jgi:hypothetical protein